MPIVILQPCGNKLALDHFQDTIETPVPLSTIQPFLSPDQFAQMEQIYPDGQVPTWGITANNKSRWEKIQRGDVTLFSGGGRIFASGVVSWKVHSSALAKTLWGEYGAGETWEYVYFLDEIHHHDISYPAFNQVVGYASNSIIQGLTVLDKTKSQKVLSGFDLESEVLLPPVSQSEFEEAVLGTPTPPSGSHASSGAPGAKPPKEKSAPSLGPDDSLNTPQTSQGRKEQGFLRWQLFKWDKEATCALCGQLFPVQFLVAAHIKPRKHCSNTERLDFEHIVAPMCKFGCDDLYEKGYVSVQGGTVVQLPAKYVTTAVEEWMKKIVGRTCLYWNPGSSGYFDWHFTDWTSK